MTTEPIDPGFAPADPTDERELGDWQTRYTDPSARKAIWFEAGYLFIHLLAVIVTVWLLCFWSDREGVESTDAKENQEPQTKSSGTKLARSASTERPSSQQPLHWPQLLHAWLGGVLGGTVFSMKWLYHVVAKNLWNDDRRLWRLFTPHLSGALALAFVVLMGSGLLVIFDQRALSSVWVCFGLSFLVGYFSDNASAKLSEVARTLFGTTKTPEPAKRSARAQRE